MMYEESKRSLAYWEQIFAEHSEQRIQTDDWLDDFDSIIQACSTPVLDLGCGFGNDTLTLMQKGKQVIACDQSENALSNLRSNLPDVYETSRVNMLEGLPFADDTFEIVIADLCLHYFNKADTLRILDEIQRVLMSGGHLFVRVNSINDVNYGAGQGEEIEHHLYLNEDGCLKRFFDEADIRELFSTFEIEYLREERMTRYAADKYLFRVVVRKKKQQKMK
ncbi:MAG: class I SAM-dependent methyltransferase [Oscillospiraceae bacterium]|nr:class I SAM-dependent methyltransferase [Oscillospiraceae bacterium]